MVVAVVGHKNCAGAATDSCFIWVVAYRVSHNFDILAYKCDIYNLEDTGVNCVFWQNIGKSEKFDIDKNLLLLHKAAEEFSKTKSLKKRFETINIYLKGCKKYDIIYKKH